MGWFSSINSLFGGISSQTSKEESTYEQHKKQIDRFELNSKLAQDKTNLTKASEIEMTNQKLELDSIENADDVARYFSKSNESKSLKKNK